MPLSQENLEELLSGLRREVRSQSVELEAQRRSTLDLQRQRDLLRQQREELETQLAQQRTEAQRGYRWAQRTAITQHKSCQAQLFSGSMCLELRSITHVTLWPAKHLNDMGKQM